MVSQLILAMEPTRAWRNLKGLISDFAVFGVVRPGRPFQVINSVIGSVAIFMINHFMLIAWPYKESLGDNAVR